MDFLLLSLSDTKILTIFHVAGYKSVPESFSSPLLYYHNNVSSIINLLASFSKYKQAYSRNDDATFIFSSSAAVYGPNGQQNAELSESSPIDPISPYGRSKAMCEAILSDYASSSSFPFKVVSLRYFNPIGAHPKYELGEDPLRQTTNLLPLMTSRLSNRTSSFCVYGDDFHTEDGSGFDVMILRIS